MLIWPRLSRSTVIRDEPLIQVTDSGGPDGNVLVVDGEFVDLSQLGPETEQPAGEALIAAAQANGMWDFLNDVDALIVPADLDAALQLFDLAQLSQLHADAQRCLVASRPAPADASARLQQIAVQLARLRDVSVVS